MLQAYRAVIQNNTIIWRDTPKELKNLNAIVIFENEKPPVSENENDKNFLELEALAEKITESSFGDPVKWQKDARKDKKLYGRN